jgi:transcriptional regulator with XRE-family HTH domain
METFEQALGQVIARLRHKAELSQEALAHQSDLHPTYISQLERGLKSPTVRAVRAIAQVLGISASKLLAKAEAKFLLR